MAIRGESKVLPRLWWRGFEGVWSFLQLDNELEVKMPLKASGDEGLKASGSNKAGDKKYGLSDVVIKAYSKGGWRKLFTMYICNKGLGDNIRADNYKKELEMLYG